MARRLPLFLLDVARCPVCGSSFAYDGTAVTCTTGHAFDVAREGYLNLTAGSSRHTGDTAEMLAHRSALHAAGHFDALRDHVAQTVATPRPALIIDIGAGNGFYTAGVLDAAPDASAIALDASKIAARRAATAHERIASVVADAWAPLPFAERSAQAVMSVFAPRNPVEFARVLDVGGRAVIAHALPEHLRELADPLGLIGIDSEKSARIESSFAEAGFDALSSADLVRTRTFTPEDALHAAMMGPSAFHSAPGAPDDALARVPKPLDVTLAVRVRVFVKTK